MLKFYEVHQCEIDVAHHHRALKYGDHMHSEFEIMYLFDGRQDIIVDGIEYTLNKGDCALIFPHIIHSYTRPDDVPKKNSMADSAVIFMPFEAIYGMFPQTHNRHPKQCIIRSKDLHPHVVLAFEKIFEEHNMISQIGWAYIIFSHTIPLLMNDSTDANENSKIVSQLMSYITLNFKKSLTLDMLSDELELNKFTISKIFSNEVGMNFRSYLGMLRANHAASLIKISDDTFEHIAEEAGFESTRSFYRVFRDVFGISPAQYREMQQTPIQ